MATMALNVARYHLATNTSDLATDTALGTATRYEFASKTIEIPETGSRTFKSVVAKVTFSDSFTTANEITGVRMGSKLGAASWVDVDRSWTQANTGDHSHEKFYLDITDNFNTNFGSGTTQTLQIALAVSSTAASNIGGSITCEVFIVYEYDDDWDAGNAQRWRLNCIPINLQSHHTSVSTTQTEFGATGGTGTAPTNQIPALDTHLEETSKTYLDSYVILGAFHNGNSGAGTTTAPFIQVDATAEVARGVIGNTLVTAFEWADIFTWNTTTHSPASTHAISLRTDVANRLVLAGGQLITTYKFDKVASTRVMNYQRVPFTSAYDDDQPSFRNMSPTNTSSEDMTWFAVFRIPEPGVVRMKQAAVVGMLNNFGSSTTTVTIGDQPSRVYSSGTGPNPLYHRCDHTGGWALIHGLNRLIVHLRHGFNRSSFSGWADVIYSSDIPDGGVRARSMAMPFFYASTLGSTPAAHFPIPGSAARLPDLPDGHQITAAFFEVIDRGTGTSRQLQAYMKLNETTELAGGEYKYWPVATGSSGVGELNCTSGYIPITRSINLTSHQTRKIDLTTAHDLILINAATFTFPIINIWLSFHTCAQTVSGNVRINGSLPTDGSVVQIIAEDVDGVEIAATATTTSGAFSVVVPDDRRDYFASYDDGTYVGRSLLARSGLSLMKNVTKDATSGQYFPSSAAEWAIVADLANLPASPVSAWTFQQASGNVPDVISSLDLVASGALSYQQAMTGMSRYGIAFTGAVGDGLLIASGQGPNPSTTSSFWLVYADVVTNNHLGRMVTASGTTSEVIYLEVFNNTIMRLNVTGGSSNGNVSPSTLGPSPYSLQINRSASIPRAYMKTEKLGGSVFPTITTDSIKGFGSTGTGILSFIGKISYAALFTGAGAEMTSPQIGMLKKLLRWDHTWYPSASIW